MKYVGVTSSLVRAVAHDVATKTLGIRFRSGTEYHYLVVPRDVYEALRSASSVGQYFNENIRDGGYPYARLPRRARRRQ